MTETDFRSIRKRLAPEDFAISDGPDQPPSDLVPEDTWRSMMSLPDDVSLRTSDHFGTGLRFLWDLWGDWISVVDALQAAVTNPAESPIARTACDATDYFQASIFNALTGHYRLAFTALRAVMENTFLGMHFQLASSNNDFNDWLNGGEFNFGPIANGIRQHSNVNALEDSLMSSLSDNLYRQAHRGIHEGGFARRLFRRLSKYAHGAPGHTDADMWQSTGPVFVGNVFADWAQYFLAVYALALIHCRLAQPKLDVLDNSDSSGTKLLFQEVIQQLAVTSEAKRLFDALPATVW